MDAKVDGFVLGATYKPTDADLQNFLRLRISQKKTTHPALPSQEF